MDHSNCGSELQLDFDGLKVSPRQSYNNEVNTPDEDGNVPLHIAVIKDDLEMLKDLLKHPNINVDYKTSSGETPLFISLWESRTEEFVTQLLTAGCDPNLPRKDGKRPLHVAMMRDLTNIAHQLIKHGANVNVLDDINHSPLDFAVIEDNVEGVCMLLYYGAHVNVSYKHSTDLLNFAIYHSIPREAALRMDLCNLKPLAVDLIKAGVDINCKTAYAGPLFYCLECDDSKLFKLIWAKVDYEELLDCHIPFLFSYLFFTRFSTAEFLECLYLILNCPKAFELLDELVKHKYRSFLELLKSFHRFRIEPSDRTTVINVCLSFGFKTNIGDINSAFEFYQFGEELEAFIYSFNNDQLDSNDLVSPLLGFILGMEEFSRIKASRLLCEIRTKFEETHNTFNVFKYFAMPSDEKVRWKNSADACVRKEYEKLLLVPEFPSLLELSRNKSYAFTLQTCNITRPYQFQDAVKNLKLPPYVQDILRFKKPIY